jgi:hypothetical protein
MTMLTLAFGAGSCAAAFPANTANPRINGKMDFLILLSNKLILLSNKV